MEYSLLFFSVFIFIMYFGVYFYIRIRESMEVNHQIEDEEEDGSTETNSTVIG